MANPIRETIVAAYVTAVKRITVAQGYELDLGERVDRFLRLRGDEIPYAAVICEGEDAEFGKPARHYQSIMTVQVYVFVRNDTALDTTLNQAMADVRKAILSDAGLKGGNDGTIPSVGWTRFTGDRVGVVDADGAEEIAVQQCTFQTLYISKEDDPYTGRGPG